MSLGAPASLAERTSNLNTASVFPLWSLLLGPVTLILTQFAPPRSSVATRAATWLPVTVWIVFQPDVGTPAPAAAFVSIV